jgi:hypothetical protein
MHRRNRSFDHALQKPAIAFLELPKANYHSPHQGLFNAAFRRGGSTRVRTTG